MSTLVLDYGSWLLTYGEAYNAQVGFKEFDYLGEFIGNKIK